MLVTAHLIENLKWLEIIVWVFIGLGAFYVFGRILHLPVDRVYQLGFTAGSMFWTWLIALSFSQLVFNNQLKTSVRGLLVVIVLATFYVAIVQAYDWKSGWLPPLVVVALIVAFRYPRLLLLAIPLCLIVAGYLTSKLISSDAYSWGTRVDAWVIVLRISRESPLFGLGFSNYYWYTPLFPIRGWSVSFNSHSQYIDLIAQVGILGLICFFWIFFEVGRLGWKLRNRVLDGFSKAYTHAVLAGVVGTLFAAFLVDWVLPFVYNIGFNGFRASILPWLFFGGLISLEQIYQTTQKHN
jgi:O-antigen ligase